MTDNRPKRPVESSIDKRTKKAASEKMAIAPMPGSGLFEVHNADSERSDRRDSTYLVEIGEPMCTCEDMQWNNPENGCKHIQRVEMTLGIKNIPENAQNVDDMLYRQRKDIDYEDMS